MKKRIVLGLILAAAVAVAVLLAFGIFGEKKKELEPVQYTPKVYWQASEPQDAAEAASAAGPDAPGV